MLTVMLLLAVAAFVSAIAGAMGKCPWWVPVILLSLALLLQSLPLGGS
jgi:hypothetical protein